jgi:hypothetical protein
MLRVISVTYGHTIELNMFIECFLLQSCPDWELNIVHDGPAPRIVHEIMERYKNDSRIRFSCTLKRNGLYGHPNRSSSLSGLRGDNDDLVLITNCDNLYVIGFVDQILKAYQSKPDIGLVYTDCIHSHFQWDYHRSEPVEGKIDMGAACIRYDIAKSVGFRWTHYSADGAYIEACAKEAIRRGLRAIHIPKGLFIHN